MEHPYVELEHTPLWEAVAAMLADLEGNRDLSLATPREYVVGFLCQELVRGGWVDAGTPSRDSPQG